jgi:hypothetical protein
MKASQLCNPCMKASQLCNPCVNAPELSPQQRLASATLPHPTMPRLNNASPQQRLASATLHNNSAEIVLAAEACSVSTLRQAPSLQLVIRHRVFPPPSTPILQLVKRHLSPRPSPSTFHPQRHILLLLSSIIHLHVVDCFLVSSIYAVDPATMPSISISVDSHR